MAQSVTALDLAGKGKSCLSVEAAAAVLLLTFGQKAFQSASISTGCSKHCADVRMWGLGKILRQESLK
jgi:hypothetical protein